MLNYFNKYVDLFNAIIINPGFLFNLWNLHFTSLINITQYAETRIPIFGLVRKSIERTYTNLYYMKNNAY
jgi:hypothetical protein